MTMLNDDGKLAPLGMPISKKLTVASVTALMAGIGAFLGVVKDVDPLILAIVFIPPALVAAVYVHAQAKVDVEKAKADTVAAKSTTVAQQKLKIADLTADHAKLAGENGKFAAHIAKLEAYVTTLEAQRSKD